MESRRTRRLLRAFPRDLALTTDSSDPLHILMDIEGRQLTTVWEYLDSQTGNLHIGTSDMNEPSEVFTSGVSIDQDTTLSGMFVQDLQDLATMSVTGFELEETLYPSGYTTDLRGVTYYQDPDTSGYIYLSADADHTVSKYAWKLTETVLDTYEFGVETQSFTETGKDEYLIIDKSEPGVVKAVLKHEPLGDVTVIDTKNLQAPWDPANSDGIEVSSAEISVSGSTLFLTSPRPSYSPATVDGNSTTYPSDYQPDRTWNSSFIAEYDYLTTEAPYGLSQPDITHWMGKPGRPYGGADSV